MKKVLKWLSITAVVVGIFLFSMRFTDGPIEIFTGGPFSTGELTEAPSDWSYLTDGMRPNSQEFISDVSLKALKIGN